MKPSSLASSLKAFFGHDMVTMRSLRFSFMNGSSFEPTLGPFRSRMLRVAFQIRFRYVSNLVSLMAQVSSTRIILVAYAAQLRSRFGFATFRI